MKAFKNYSFFTVLDRKWRRDGKSNHHPPSLDAAYPCPFGYSYASRFPKGLDVPEGLWATSLKGAWKAVEKNLLSGGFNSLLQVITSPLEA